MSGTIEFTGKINSYLIGKFPFKNLIGNRYIMMICDYDRNSILAESMKKSEGQSIINAYEILYNSPEIKVLQPSLQKIDN